MTLHTPSKAPSAPRRRSTKLSRSRCKEPNALSGSRAVVFVMLDVVERKGEDTADLLQHAETHTLPQGDDHLAVGPGLNSYCPRVRGECGGCISLPLTASTILPSGL